MGVNEIHVGDAGTTIRVKLKDKGQPVDVTGASTLQFIFADPDGNTTAKTATAADAVRGILEYTLESTLFDEAGTWEMQAYVVIGTSSWKSDITEIVVYANL